MSTKIECRLERHWRIDECSFRTSPRLAGGRSAALRRAGLRQLVELHGGVIRAEAGERGGARFVIELPAVGPQEVYGIAAVVPEGLT